ncbi:Glycosyl_transferase family 2 protein [Hexamita inflata]|uniref:Glycosyl transferase family 2 protein n=1 Tax=Hexamita inflata TaxID=28002 RepID=A0AA86QMH6_9EUKA|nr:Glycosyl transferase family 2 protein [Hexamita inflata]
MWGKLIRTTLLINAIKRLNILAANRLTYAEDHLFYSAMLTLNTSCIGISTVGYVYHINQNSLSNAQINQEKLFQKIQTFQFTKMKALPYVQEIKQKTGIVLDTYILTEKRFNAQDYLTFDSLRHQITIMQGYVGLGMFNSGEAHQKMLKDMWEEKVFSRCTFQNGGWLQNDGSEFILPDEVLGSGFVELWNGQNSEEIFCKGLSLKQTFELIDHIWEQRESGVDVQKETENSYGGWYNNYLKAIGK